MQNSSVIRVSPYQGLSDGNYVLCCAWSVSGVQVLVTPRTVALQVPLSVEFHKQDYWSALPLLTPRDLPDPGIKPISFVCPALAGGLFNEIYNENQSLWRSMYCVPDSVPNAWSALSNLIPGGIQQREEEREREKERETKMKTTVPFLL